MSFEASECLNVLRLRTKCRLRGSWSVESLNIKGYDLLVMETVLEFLQSENEGRLHSIVFDHGKFIPEVKMNNIQRGSCLSFENGAR